MVVRETVRDFGSFYREYAKTGIHAASAAALTGFGLLASRYSGFLLVAVGVYVLPPIYIYLTRDVQENHDTDSDTSSEDTETEPKTEPETESEPESDSAPDAGTGTWTETDTPTDESLYDVAMSRDGPYAVGASGTVLARQAGSDTWNHVLEEGPTVQSNDLRGVDVSSDGRHVWFAGDSGVLARYAVDADRLTDYSSPNDITSAWEDIAVTGTAGDESIYLVTGSGEVLRGASRGNDIRWGSTVKPGSGSSMASVEFTDENENRGYLCDTNQTVYETTDGGESYAIIGIDDANCTFTDIAAISPEQIVVSGDNGTVSRYDANGENWTTLSVDEHAITAIDGQNGDGLASSERGTIYEYTSDGWESVSDTTLMNATLHGIALGTDASGVAVGDNGMIIYKQGE
jgi:photosystem II stability/assembly factor-like uncharacterized protein